MPQTQEKEQLTSLTGKLSNSFAAVAVVERLHRKILSTQSDNTRAQAASVLGAFYNAAERLREREAEFSNRQRPDQTAPDLKINLRSPDHFSAIRAFKGMGAELMAIDPVAGKQLIEAVENSIAAPQKSRAQTPKS